MYSKGNRRVELEGKHLIIHHKASSAKNHRDSIKSPKDPKKKNRKENRGLLKKWEVLNFALVNQKWRNLLLKKKKIEIEYTLSSTQSHTEKNSIKSTDTQTQNSRSVYVKKKKDIFWG